MEVSWNRGTPKSSILVGFPIQNHPAIGVPQLWEITISGECLGLSKKIQKGARGHTKQLHDMFYLTRSSWKPWGWLTFRSWVIVVNFPSQHTVWIGEPQVMNQRRSLWKPKCSWICSNMCPAWLMIRSIVRYIPMTLPLYPSIPTRNADGSNVPLLNRPRLQWYDHLSHQICTQVDCL